MDAVTPAPGASSPPPRGRPHPRPGSTPALVTGCSTHFTSCLLSFRKQKRKVSTNLPPHHQVSMTRRLTSDFQCWSEDGLERPPFPGAPGKGPRCFVLRILGITETRHCCHLAPFCAGVSGAPAPGVALPRHLATPVVGGPAEGRAEPSPSHRAPQTRRFSPPRLRPSHSLEPGLWGQCPVTSHFQP